jgi:HemY protein
MLLSVLRFLVLSSPVVFLTVWFSDNPGALVVDWLGWHVETGIPAFLVAVLVLFVAWSGLEAAVAFLLGLPRRLHASRRVKAQGQGMGVLLAALDAVVAGKPQDVVRLGAEAARLLDVPALPERLAALRIDVKPNEIPIAPKAQEAKTKPGVSAPAPVGAAKKLGWWGRRGARPPVAPQLPPLVEPSRPFVAKPAQPSPVAEDATAELTAFSAQARAGEWSAAVAALGDGVAGGRIGKTAAAPSLALALTAHAKMAEDYEVALGLLREAIAACPGFLPAVLHLTRLLVSMGRGGEAERVVEAAWHVAPATPLAEAWISLGGDVPRLPRIEALIHPDTEEHPDSQLALGEAAVAAEQWGRARRHLVAVAKIRTDVEACRLMAVVEQRDHGDAVSVEMWRRKERNAPVKGWHCPKCGAVTAEWEPLCPSCQAVGVIEWSAYRGASAVTA